MNSDFSKFILLCVFFIFSCDQETKDLNGYSKPTNAGVVISFDDTSIAEWYKADSLLRKYDWKATFCVSNLNVLQLSEVRTLQELQRAGHEIAGHGLHHFDAPKFVAKYGIDAYISQEINPMLALMQFYNFKVSSFTYPYGFRNAKIDKALFKKFTILRATTYGAQDPKLQTCFYDQSKIAYAIGIDSDHPKFSIPYVKSLLAYAFGNHKILVVFGHKPVVKLSGPYQTRVETLEFICSYVKKNKMQFYSLSDLGGLK